MGTETPHLMENQPIKPAPGTSKPSVLGFDEPAWTAASCTSPVYMWQCKHHGHIVTWSRFRKEIQENVRAQTLMLRLVTNLPSRPAKGEVFTMKVIRTVGSSTCPRV